MDADVAQLQRFADVPYVIEAPASRAPMLSAAVRASRGAVLRFDDVRGVTDGRFRAMVEAIRADLRANLAPRRGYGVTVYDVTARDPSAEMAKVDESLRAAGPVAKSVHAANDGGAFAGPFRTPDGVRCVAFGMSPGHDVGRILATGTGRPDIPRGGLGDAAFHYFTMLHETGHCLLGASEAKADAFAGLMALRNPTFPEGALATWADWREREELTLALAEDDHDTSHAIRAVAARASRLRADPAFLSMSVEEVAGLANAIAEAHEPKASEKAHVASVRRSLLAGAKALDPRSGIREGVTALEAWMGRHRDVPEIDRVVTLLKDAREGVRAREAPAFEPGRFRAAISALAAGGDRVAGAMLAGYDAAPDAKGVLAAAALHTAPKGFSPYRFGPTPYQDRVVSWGRPHPAAASADAEPDAPGIALR